MTYKAYVDGSYIDEKVGYGAILLDGESLVQEFFGEVTEHTESRQVAGELVAVMTVLDYCQNHNISTIEIFYDYTGIENWATGRWKTNNPLTRNYAQYMRQSAVKVIWRKVKSHSGNTWNDKADELAKQGAGYSGRETSTTTNKVPSEQVQTMLSAIGEAFVHHLNEQGIQAHFDSMKNNQYARIIINKGSKRLGFFDLYDTKNRPLDPYLHGFSDKALQSKLVSLWTDYKAQL